MPLIEPLVWIPLAAVALTIAVLVAVRLSWRRTSMEDRQLLKRIGGLPLRPKLRLARAILSDRRIPVAVRILPVALVLYLAMPLDIVPDFIPVLGQLDDALVVLVGVALLLRFARREVLAEHVAALEGADGEKAG
ncbi:MAG TPA: YkvA family protein [Dehalococcoidia bacterium]|nr:YkvA family protein [Dehalococcoidia bacterium]